MNEALFYSFNKEPKFPEVTDQLTAFLAKIDEGDLRTGDILADWLEEQGQEGMAKKVRQKITDHAIYRRILSIVSQFSAMKLKAEEALVAALATSADVGIDSIIALMDDGLRKQVYRELGLQILIMFPPTREYVKAIRRLLRATDAMNDFTRIRMREDTFLRRIMPPIVIGNDDLDRSVDTDVPVKIIDT